MRMGKLEVLNLLKKKKFKGQWLTHKQIKNLLNRDVSVSLTRLRRQSEVKYKSNPNRKGGKGGYLYSSK